MHVKALGLSNHVVERYSAIAFTKKTGGLWKFDG